MSSVYNPLIDSKSSWTVGNGVTEIVTPRGTYVVTSNHDGTVNLSIDNKSRTITVTFFQNMLRQYLRNARKDKI